MRRVARLPAHSGPAWHCEFSRDGFVASCGADGLFHLWGAVGETGGTWRCLGTAGKDAHSRAIRSVAWSPDGSSLAVGSFDSTATVWQIKRQIQIQQQQQQQDGEDTTALSHSPGPQLQVRLLQTIVGHEHEVKGVAWNWNGSFLATCSRDKTIWIYKRVGSGEEDWGVHTPQQQQQQQQHEDAEEDDEEFLVASVLTGHSQDVKAVRWHPRRDWLASASYDDTIAIWGWGDDDWVMLKTLRGHSSTVWALAFDSLGSRLFSGSADLTLRIWSCLPPDGSVGGARLPRLSQWCVAPFFRPLEAAAATAAKAAAAAPAAAGEEETNDEETSILEQQQPDAWRCTAVLQGQHSGVIYAVSVHPTKNLLATACGDGCVRIYALTDTGARLLHCEEEAHESDVNAVAWSRDEDAVLLASVGDDGFLTIWSVEIPD